MAVQAKVFVVGATGLLGSRLVSAFLDKCVTVRALVRPGDRRREEESPRRPAGPGS